MNAIQKYFKYRQSLIDQYAKGDMTKREYLQKNYEAVVYGEIGPFRNMDTVEKALFNYQYYNALAKENKTISTTRDMDYELKTGLSGEKQLLLQQEGQSNADSTTDAGFSRRCGVFREGAEQVSEGKAV